MRLCVASAGDPLKPEVMHDLSGRPLEVPCRAMPELTIFACNHLRAVAAGQRLFQRGVVEGRS